MNLADSQMDFAEQEKVWSQWSWILPNSPLENKARKRAFLYSLNTSLKPVWMKIQAAHRRKWEKYSNKKSTFYKVP